ATVAIAPGPSIASVIAVAAIAASIVAAGTAIAPIAVAPLDIFAFDVTAFIDNASSVAAVAAAAVVAAARGTPTVVAGSVATTVGARIGTIVRIAIVTGLRRCGERTEQREETRQDQGPPDARRQAGGSTVHCKLQLQHARADHSDLVEKTST